MNNTKKIWTIKSHVTIGLMFIAATIVMYLLTKPEISENYLTMWYWLLLVSIVLNIILIIRGLTDKKPDK